jgi:DNA repair protein RecO (recombination protein O)
MPLLESDAIILKTYPLGEADRIVAFFSRDRGKVRGVANGARRMKNRFGASLEPLAHSRIQYFERENRDLVRIQSAEILDSPMGLFADYDRAMFAGQIIDLTDRFLPEHEPHDAVFRLVRMTLQALEKACALDVAGCYFEVWMLRLAGVFPDLFLCSACSRPLDGVEERHLARGLQTVICAKCDHSGGVAVHPEVPAVLQWVLRNRLEPETSAGALAGLDRGVRNLHELNQYWIRHYFER